jgi:hypothetical protein
MQCFQRFFAFGCHVMPHLMRHPACLREAAPAKPGLCFSGFLLEFIPLKNGAGMTTIVKGFIMQYTNLRQGQKWPCFFVVNTSIRNQQLSSLYWSEH